MFLDFWRHLVSIVEELFKHEEIWVLLFLVGLGSVLVLFLPPIDFVALIKELWWLWLFLILFPAFHSLWLFWRQELFKSLESDFRMVVLEMRIPREITKSPQAMEQILRSIYALRNVAGDLREKYWDGEITVWFGLEIVTFGGEVHFYLRVPVKRRNLIEAAFFSYYTDVELVEVPDYIDKLPKDIPETYARDYDMWGSEMVLVRDDAYPIKTYPNFEQESVTEKKEVSLDPISTFIELLANVKKEEVVGVQILIAPAAHDWARKWDKLIEELQTPATMTVTAGETEEGSSSRQIPIARSPVQTDVLEAVENNLAKPAFDTMIRFVYFSPKSIFYDSFARRGLSGVFNQYAISNLNGFIQNYSVSTRTRIWNWPHIFPKWRNEYKKQRILYNYLRRECPPETFMGRLITSYLLNWNFSSRRFQMNVEGIATLFHPPTAAVLTAPHIKRLESRKAGPPSGLAIFGEEEEIEKYK
ncbi:MAG: hypothetical protein AAB884_00855 [Patescibacteria group bacterium]